MITNKDNAPYLSDKQIAIRYGISRATVWRWVKEGKLPSPRKLSIGSTRWKLKDLMKFESDLEAA
jgi:prophage regulatory protein